MEKAICAGGTVVKEEKGVLHLLLIVFDKYGTLALPKGHVINGEVSKPPQGVKY